MKQIKILLGLFGYKAIVSIDYIQVSPQILRNSRNFRRKSFLYLEFYRFSLVFVSDFPWIILLFAWLIRPNVNFCFWEGKNIQLTQPDKDNIHVREHSSLASVFLLNNPLKLFLLISSFIRKKWMWKANKGKCFIPKEKEGKRQEK